MMRFYWILFKKYLKLITIYRANFVGFVFQNILVFILFFTFFKWAGNISIMSRKELVMYYFLLMGFFNQFIPTVQVGFFQFIRSGKLDEILILPIMWEYYFIVTDAASMFFSFLINIVVFGILAIFMKNFIIINLSTLPAFILSSLLSLILYFELRLLFTQTAFYIEKDEAMTWWSWFISRFLSGGIFPVMIFPELLRKLIYMTPFPYLIDFPISIYLGKQSLTLFHTTLFLSYIVALFFINSKLSKVGIKRYMAYGG